MGYDVAFVRLLGRVGLDVRDYSAMVTLAHP